tara:strand:+ start:179 stop:580 length:402 start_codon:yes stop_codon:yes gene_type:complete
MKRLLILLSLLFILGCSSQPQIDLTQYFSDQLQNKVITEKGQPIEGFEPFMFKDVFPGLLDEDFNNVDASLGIYGIKDTKLSFTFSETDLIHSASHSITKRGMEILLSNLSKRLNIELTNKESVDEIINLISS